MASPRSSSTVQSQPPRRILDQFYLVFFIANVFFMLAIDLQHFYPSALQNPTLGAIRGWYIVNNKDQFFIDPPKWFQFYSVLELVYQLPLSIWAIVALGNRNPSVPVHLLVFAVMSTVTTVTCMADISGWTKVTEEEKGKLLWMYGGYLGPLGVMGVDMFLRIKAEFEAA